MCEAGHAKSRLRILTQKSAGETCNLYPAAELNPRPLAGRDARTQPFPGRHGRKPGNFARFSWAKLGLNETDAVARICRLIYLVAH